MCAPRRAALTRGAMMRMPSTPCSRSRSTAEQHRLAVERCTLDDADEVLGGVAARSIANSVDAGPYSVVSKLTTPSVRDRPVTSARATELGR